MRHRSIRAALATLTVAACATAPATTPAPAVTPAAASRSAITPADLRARLYTYADDSMRGRQAGTVDNIRSTAWIAERVKRIGLQPAGDNGTFFQDVPLGRRALVQNASFVVDGTPYTLWTDFGPYDVGGTAPSIDGVGTVFAGRLADTAHMAPPSAGAGKIVIVRPAPGMPIFLAYARVAARYPQAVAVAFGNQDAIVRQLGLYFAEGQVRLKSAEEPSGTRPELLILGARLTNALLHGDVETLAPGTVGRTAHGSLAFVETPAPARNVVAILPGTDPALRGQYVALGAHSDHIGVRKDAQDQDSLRAYNQALHRLGAADPFTEIDPSKRATIHVNVDSLHHIRPAIRDSINNGADDDGSGSVGLIEIAQAWKNAQGADRPRRSVIFVWHTAEELGLFGSEWFTDHPTIPRDSIVAQVNIDMIGRGSAADIVGGGPRYVELIGPRRLSTEYAHLIEQVNAAEPVPFNIDYTFDADGHPENIYCRSDHANYARYGIPVAFFSTGQHSDYHQVSDEPQFIDYDHYASVVRFVYDVARTVANRDARLVVDGPKPDPKAECRQ
ncbi:MAG: M28 family peptidase [Gemmatimonadaceae bacterium]